MYRVDDIVAALSNVVGWRPDLNPANEIAPDLSITESGLYFQDEHPLVTLDNVRHAMPNPADMTFPVWDNALTYPKGKIVAQTVQKGAKTYEAIRDVPAEIPLTDAGYWREYDFLSGYVRQITQSGIAHVVQKYVNDQMIEKQAKNLLERRVFFDGAGRLDDLIPNHGKLCGYEIVPVRGMGVTTRLDRVGFQMTGAGTFNLYIFHSSRRGPRYVVSVTLTGSIGYQWIDLSDIYLPYISEGNNSGGSWYVVYSQDELPGGMQAVNINRDWSKSPCGSCNRGQYQAWQEITKYISVFPFCTTPPSGFAANPTMWDVARNAYTMTWNYGMNCTVTMMCDLTDFVIENRRAFQSVIAKQVAIDLLRSMALNPSVRINNREANVNRTDILYEIDGNPMGRPGGLAYSLDQAYKAIYVDTAGMDRICMPCNNHGVRYKSAT